MKPKTMDLEGKYYTVNNISESEMQGYFSLLEKRIPKSSAIQYLKLGQDIIKVESLIPLFTSSIEKQCAFIRLDNAEKYTKRFCIWQDDIKSILSVNYQDVISIALNPKNADGSYLVLTDDRLDAYNAKTGTYYLMYSNDFDLNMDVIRQMGHVAVRYLYRISKMPDQLLIHSAVVGLNNKGVLLSARGGGGKSTLAVSALLNGFQYISDDYSILKKTAGGLFAYPIYSTINLFPPMMEKMPGLKANYLWNSWWQPYKHTMEISGHHDSFVTQLPVYALVFPVIADIENPCIKRMEDKGKAIVQVAHSGLKQLTDSHKEGEDYVNAILSLVKDLDIYQINLSPDLQKNVECLRSFVEKL
ncbi:hypothetical protein FACS1894182_07380 [Bacteroidia bacterium]|nr:hypothetical protein FACS1894182_07380 [Bacteroidia bacterium]